MDVKSSGPQVADGALRMPADFPALPPGVIERFPEMAGWFDEVSRFMQQNRVAVDEFARTVLDVTNIAGVLIVDPNESSLYIKGSRGAGKWADPDTGFFVNRESYFSLGSALTWDPVARELTVQGNIIATGGTIGGWDINASTLSKNDAVLDSAGQLALGTGNDIIILSATDATYRMWVGNATAGTAAFSVTKAGVLSATGATISGSITATAGAIGGFNIGADYIRDAANTFGLASTVTGGDDVRFWAGATFANRATAPYRVTESGDFRLTGTGSASFVFDGSNVQISTNSNLAVNSTLVITDDMSFQTWQGGTSANRGLFVQRAGGVAPALGMLSFGTSGLIEANISAGTYGALTAQVGTGVGLLLNTKYYNGAAWVSGSSMEIRNNASVSGTASASCYVQMLLNNTAGQAGVWRWGSDGILLIGGTTLSLDTNLYRSAANTLKTDDDFIANSFSGSGASITALNGSNISTGTVAPARLGSGSGGSSKYLREDSTWQTIGGGGDLLAANNLSDLTNTTTARSNLGLGSVAVKATTNMGNLTVGTLASSAADGFTPLMNDDDNAISFKWDGANLKVRVDATTYTVTIT